MMNLTAKSYFTRAADLEYWSASQAKSFMACPARAVAELRGEYARPVSSALLVGGYVDAFFSGTMDAFTKQHPEMYKRDGALKSEYVRAEAMIERVSRDDVFMEYLKGDRQRILTGELFGLPWKAKPDFILDGKRICDLKTVKDMEFIWAAEEGRIHPVEYWKWPLQLAIYQALEGHRLPCYLAIVTKEPGVNYQVVEVPQHRLDLELKALEEAMPRLDAMKRGLMPPDRCEDCDYCRETRQLTEPVSLDDLVGL